MDSFGVGNFVSPAGALDFGGHFGGIVGTTAPSLPGSEAPAPRAPDPGTGPGHYDTTGTNEFQWVPDVTPTAVVAPPVASIPATPIPSAVVAPIVTPVSAPRIPPPHTPEMGNWQWVPDPAGGSGFVLAPIVPPTAPTPNVVPTMNTTGPQVVPPIQPTGDSTPGMVVGTGDQKIVPMMAGGGCPPGSSYKQNVWGGSAEFVCVQDPVPVIRSSGEDCPPGSSWQPNTMGGSAEFVCVPNNPLNPPVVNHPPPRDCPPGSMPVPDPTGQSEFVCMPIETGGSSTSSTAPSPIPMQTMMGTGDTTPGMTGTGDRTPGTAGDCPPGSSWQPNTMGGSAEFVCVPNNPLNPPTVNHRTSGDCPLGSMPVPDPTGRSEFICMPTNPPLTNTPMHPSSGDCPPGSSWQPNTMGGSAEFVCLPDNPLHPPMHPSGDCPPGSMPVPDPTGRSEFVCMPMTMTGGTPSSSSSGACPPGSSWQQNFGGGSAEFVCVSDNPLAPPTGASTPGPRGTGDITPGFMGTGDSTPGPRGMGDTTPGFMGTGDATPGTLGMGDFTPGTMDGLGDTTPARPLGNASHSYPTPGPGPRSSDAGSSPFSTVDFPYSGMGGMGGNSTLGSTPAVGTCPPKVTYPPCGTGPVAKGPWVMGPTPESIARAGTCFPQPVKGNGQVIVDERRRAPPGCVRIPSYGSYPAVSPWLSIPDGEPGSYTGWNSTATVLGAGAASMPSDLLTQAGKAIAFGLGAYVGWKIVKRKFR